MKARIVLVCAVALIAGCGGGGGDGAPFVPSKFLYASVYSHDSNGVFSGAIYAFGVDTSGRLNPVSGSPFAPTSVSVASTFAITRDSKFLYSSDSITGRLSAFLIQPDGSLTVAPASPFATPDFPQALVTHPTADFLYVFGSSGNVTVYAIDSATGAISLTSSTPGISLGAITSDGRYLYGYDSAGIAGFSTDAATGSLSPVPGSPPQLNFGFDFLPGPMAIDPAGKFLYVSNVYSLMGFPGPLYAYSIDAGTGALTPVPGSPFLVGGVQDSLAVDASGKFLIVSITPKVPGNCLAVLSIDPSTGGLTPVPGSPFGRICGVVAADPSGPYVYIGGFGAAVVYTLLVDQASGALTLIASQGVPGMEAAHPIALTH